MRRSSPPSSPSSPFALSLHAATGREYAAFVARNLRRAHALLRPPLRELSVAFVGDQRMSRLHSQFMGIASPTDVLTFELDYDSRGRVAAGEVVVCLPEARRQARARATPVRRELLLYALHGMLHLCGFDDRTDPAFRKMHRTEDDTLTRLGLGPVFAPKPAARSGASRRSQSAARPARTGARR
jgi:probable rRNA maturation factor